MLNKSKKGFTYVELLIAIAIMAMIMYLAVDLFNMSIITHKESSKQFEIQSDITYSGNTFSETIRDATAIFLLNNSKFDRSRATESNIQSASGIQSIGMSAGWNYIALNSEKTKIYNFVWDDTSNRHIPFELTLPEKNHNGNIVEYAVSFSHRQDEIQARIDRYKHKASLTPAEQQELKELRQQLENSRSSIDFSIEGRVTNNRFGIGSRAGQQNLNEYKVNSTVYAQNTRQIMDISNGEEVTAIAYRTTDLVTQSTRYQKPAIALVLDFSGSMLDDLNGRSVNGSQAHRRRIELLKVEYRTIIDKLTAQGDFNLYVIPFSSQGFHSTLFVNTDTAEQERVKNMLPMEIKKANTTDQEYLDAVNYLSNFKVYGWTNYGDAVRVGIEYLKNSGAQSTYLLVLSDGQPTAVTVKNGNLHYADSGHGYRATNDRRLDEDGATNYINGILDYQKRNSSNYTPNLVYLVGFSNVRRDHARLEQIKDFFERTMGMNPDTVKVVKAADQYQLSNAFDGFVADINADLWYFDGP